MAKVKDMMKKMVVIGESKIDNLGYTWPENLS